MIDREIVMEGEKVTSESAGMGQESRFSDQVTVSRG